MLVAFFMTASGAKLTWSKEAVKIVHGQGKETTGIWRNGSGRPSVRRSHHQSGAIETVGVTGRSRIGQDHGSIRTDGLGLEQKPIYQVTGNFNVIFASRLPGQPQ